jgi:hypothetical protein
MEEILASIRRIISEDGDEEKAAPGPAKPAPKPAPEPIADEEEDDVLELTDIVPDEEPARRASPAVDNDLVMVDRAPARAPAAQKPVSRPRVADDALISDTVRDRASSSFMQLSRNVLVSESDSRSLEALVQEMLRPVLESWLNEHLPQIVERLVQEEIERVTRHGR